MADAHANLAYSTIATAPSPATSGTSVVVAAGQGTRFPAVPFNATIGAVGAVLTPANAEIVRVTNISTDTLTITRAQEGTVARSVIVGDQIIAGITAKTFTDIENGMLPNVSKTANYTMTTTDAEVLADSSAGAFTVTLPTAVGAQGKMYTIKRVDNASTSGLYAVTVATTSSQTIDGFPTDLIGSPLESVTYTSDGANWKKNWGWLPALPHSARINIWSTSHNSPPRNPYATSSAAWQESSSVFFPWDGNQWGGAIKDAFGSLQYENNTRQYAVPAVAAGSDATFFVDYMPADGTIEAVYYVPQTTITGANTNTRSHAIQVDTASGTNQIISFLQYNSGTNITAGQFYEFISLQGGAGLCVTSVFFPQPLTPYFPAIRGTNSSSAPYPQGLWFKSTHIGTGIADPGGMLYVRYGTRTRNYSVTGSQLMSMTGPPGMNWTTVFSWCATSRPNAPEVNVTANAATSAVSISCSALQFPLVNGARVRFSSGNSATLTAAANYGATSITVSALAAGINAGEQGHVAFVNGTSGTGFYESLSPQGLNIFFTGVNDTATTIDRPAWREVVRSVISRVCCPAFLTPEQGNVVYTNGGGTWSTLSASVGLASSGCLPYIFNGAGTLTGMKSWGGTVSGAPKFVASLGPAYEGGAVDVFFLAAAGVNRGVTASITVDGATPPQGAVTINTEAVGTSGLHSRAVTGTYTTVSGNPSITLSSASSITAADLGKLITGTNIPAGTTIITITDTTHIVMSQNATGSTAGLSAAVAAWIPMVKRLTGLTAGAGHTITATITASTAAATSAIAFVGIGVESYNPPTPVTWLNILTAVGGSTTAAANYNTDASNVIGGTAAAVSGNSTEPAFGSNVQYVDVASLFNQNPAYFLSDGLHLNSAGCRLVDRTIFKTLHDFFTPDQLIAR